MVLCGDYDNGSIYELDPENYTDNGQNIKRLRRAPHLVADFQRQYFDELQIQFQPGVGFTGLSTSSFEVPGSVYLGDTYAIAENEILTIPFDGTYILGVADIASDVTTNDPQAMLRWSNDGGSTWSKEYWVSIGTIGRYKNRAIWRRLGTARDRIFEVSISDPVKAVIVSANLKASSGDN